MHERILVQVQRVVSNYRQLAAYCDSFFAQVKNTLADQIACIEGCAHCCELQTVCALEAVVLLSRSDLAPAVRADHHACALLQESRCCCYSARPIICRTHGLPLKRAGEHGVREVHHCALCFYGSEANSLPDSLVLDDDLITLNLMRLNMALCMLLERPGLAAERFYVAALAGHEAPDVLIECAQAYPPD
ncbi:MAG: hypothetical protein GF398_01030 [Chitinivibrionales bacterium]|nr:hypothetical protein [Chitinivibrionales bacterium]